MPPVRWEQVQKMTDKEKREYMEDVVMQTKKYCHIDYDDDEDIVEIIIEAVFEKMHELIPGFDRYAMTSRQRLLMMMLVNDQYDHTDAYHETDKKLSNAASSMLLSEMYGRGRK